MKKLKVMLVQLSPKLEDGSRKTIQEKEICSCNERGTAELILYRLRPDYEVLCKTDVKDNEYMWFLTIR